MEEQALEVRELRRGEPQEADVVVEHRAGGSLVGRKGICIGRLVICQELGWTERHAPLASRRRVVPVSVIPAPVGRMGVPAAP